MAKPKLYYFDAPVSRGEECRLAMFVGGFDFEDVRLSREQWAAKKPTSPNGGMPILEIEGKPPLGHSNAILSYVGKKTGLLPADDFEAARQEGLMMAVEEMRIRVGLTLSMDDAQKKATREQLASTYLPAWAKFLETQLSDDGPFSAGSKIQIADFKLFIGAKWITSGTLDHIPAATLDSAKKLLRVRDAVAAHPKVKEWYSRS